MKALAYYFALPFIYTLSYLPLSILYLISDLIIYPFLYHLIGYRKGVVRKNLENSFPDWPEAKRRKEERDFFHYLSDLFMESIKSFTISKKELLKRIKFDETIRLYDEVLGMDKNVIMTMGHYGNYEWLVQAFDSFISQQLIAPYHQLANPYFDRLFLKARSRFGTQLFPTRETMPKVRQALGKPFVLGLANDQSAPPKQSYWTTFLNQETSFFWGPEKISRKFDMPVIFARMSLIKRGYYQISFEWLTKEARSEPNGGIIEKHAQLLEGQICQKPTYWLWSHKRWKHKRPV